MKEYKTVEFESKDEFVEKKSRFIGYVKPVKTQEEATNFINSIKSKHLGRYGVLRNNWYELSVTSVSGPGDAEVPSIEDEWDDPKEAFVKIQVNILSWAKRQQNVDL